MKTSNEKLQEIFALSLKIKGAICYHQPSARTIHIYTFVDGKVGHDMSIEGSYSEWVKKYNPDSLDSVIKKLQQIILKS
jgi:hypothetical protein